MKKNIDQYNRSIDYIRISVTDRCNLRCEYCMPPDGLQWIHRNNILRYEEIIRIVTVAAKKGIKKVRITGGEPLIRRGVISFIKSLKEIKELDDITLTTNGVLLADNAKRISSTGIDRINISLDSLNSEKFKTITGGGDLAAVLNGIEKAKESGLTPIKINVVLQKGINDDEVGNFVRRAENNFFHIRFIEYMPVCSFQNWEKRYIPNAVIRDQIQSEYGPLFPLPSKKIETAESYTIPGFTGVIGFINSVSNNFCGRCNKVRLSADGKIYQCLFAKSYIDFKIPLRQGCDDETIEQLLDNVIDTKPAGHTIAFAAKENALKNMASIGG